MPVVTGPPGHTASSASHDVADDGWSGTSIAIGALDEAHHLAPHLGTRANFVSA
jgi:hypothetical protein